MRPFPLLVSIALLAPALLLAPPAAAQVPEEYPCTLGVHLALRQSVGASGACEESGLLAFWVVAGQHGVTCRLDLFTSTVYGCTTP